RYVAVEHSRVDVRPARDGRSVAKQLGDRGDCALDRALAARSRARRRLFAGQRDRRQHGRIQGPEVLGAELITDLALEIVVDVIRADRYPFSANVVGEQLIGAAAPPLEPAEQLAREWVGDRLDASLDALAELGEH